MFVGFYPVYLFIALLVLIWLEILLMRARQIPEMSFVEQPPTFAEAFARAAVPGLAERLHRRAGTTWRVVAVLGWVLFYLVH